MGAKPAQHVSSAQRASVPPHSMLPVATLMGCASSPRTGHFLFTSLATNMEIRIHW